MKKLLLSLVVLISGMLLGRYQGPLKDPVYVVGSKAPVLVGEKEIDNMRFDPNVSPVVVHQRTETPNLGAQAYAHGPSIYSKMTNL